MRLERARTTSDRRDDPALDGGAPRTRGPGSPGPASPPAHPLRPLRQSPHQRFVVTEEADASAARHAVARYAREMALTPERAGRAALVATELATNLICHAEPGGWLLVRPVPPSSVEIIAVDRGPGIPDVEAVLRHRSRVPGRVAGLGVGLAAVRRVSSLFDIHSKVGEGTVVLSVVDLGQAGADPVGARRCAGVSVAIVGACGDGWATTEVDGNLAVALVDGLGHGAKASAAADAALDAFAVDPADLAGFLTRANEAMRPTRGGALTACLLRPDQGEVRYVAVGNVSGRVVGAEGNHGLVPSNGTVGLTATMPRTRVMSQECPADAGLVLWTDGLTTRVGLLDVAELRAHDPAVVAARLFRDYSQDRDDATVVVVRAAARE